MRVKTSVVRFLSHSMIFTEHTHFRLSSCSFPVWRTWWSILLSYTIRVGESGIATASELFGVFWLCVFVTVTRAACLRSHTSVTRVLFWYFVCTDVRWEIASPAGSVSIYFIFESPLLSEIQCQHMVCVCSVGLSLPVMCYLKLFFLSDCLKSILLLQGGQLREK